MASASTDKFQNFENLDQLLEKVMDAVPNKEKRGADAAVKSILKRLSKEIPVIPAQGFKVFEGVTKHSKAAKAERKRIRKHNLNLLKNPPTLPNPLQIKEKPRRGKFSYRPKIGYNDAHFQSELQALRDLIMGVAQSFFSWTDASEKEVHDMWVAVSEYKILSHYINYISINPPEQFQSLLEDPEQRRCLVFGIISKALTHWVFDDLMFGGSLIERDALHLQDVASVNSEGKFLPQTRSDQAKTTTLGFARTKQRAQQINIFLGDQVVPKGFGHAVETIAVRIHALLAPLIVPESVFPANVNPNILEHYPHAPCLHQLYKVVRKAAKTSLDMRREGDCIYYLHTATKGELVDGQKMTGFNEKSFHHQKKLEQAVEKSERDALREKQKDLPLEEWDFPEPRAVYVGIVCFPEVVAYRKGNGQLGGENQGLRYKQICRGYAFYRYMKRQPVGEKAISFDAKLAAARKEAWKAKNNRNIAPVRIANTLFGKG